MTTGPPVQVLLGLGSNLGDREAALLRVLHLIRETPEIELASVSHLYETTPLDCPVGSGDYLNAAVVVTVCSWSARQLLNWCLRTELAAGRERTQINAPRTLDIDLLLFGEQIVATSGLKVPHPRLHSRAFVLVPAADVAGDWCHPVEGRTVRELLYALDETCGVSRVESLEWAHAISHSSR